MLHATTEDELFEEAIQSAINHIYQVAQDETGRLRYALTFTWASHGITDTRQHAPGYPGYETAQKILAQLVSVTEIRDAVVRRLWDIAKDARHEAEAKAISEAAKAASEAA